MMELIQAIKSGRSSKFRAVTLAVISLAGLMLLTGMAELWLFSEEYGHGLMVVVILGYILYSRREQLVVGKIAHSWLAYPLAFLALVAVIAGKASGISVVSMYGVLVFAVSIILVVGGVALLKRLLVPLLILWLLIPLPNPFGPMLTSGLQLISSQFGVAFIRAVGGVVYLEGNVIDMGGVQLLVAEACSGLRYLFPLMSLGAIIGYMLHAPLWIRWSVFLITVPITIALNSMRIGLTGILAEIWGTAHTEGFLHFFEGWVVFVFASLLLVAILWVMLKLSATGKSIRDVLIFASPEAPPVDGIGINQMLESPSEKPVAWSLGAVMFFAVLVLSVLAMRTEVLPERKSLEQFPLELGGWNSREYRLPPETENVAGASEYYYGDFSKSGEGAVNLYISFYKTQLGGQIPHSPKVCIPGGGWNIEKIEKVRLVDRHGKPFEANRLLIAKGGRKQLTYYWLKQGEKMYSHELLARVDLVRSSLLQNRTDGSLIRLVTDFEGEGGLRLADERLLKFSGLMLQVLPEYVPD